MSGWTNNPHRCDLPTICQFYPQHTYFECDYCKTAWTVAWVSGPDQHGVYRVAFKYRVGDSEKWVTPEL